MNTHITDQLIHASKALTKAQYHLDKALEMMKKDPKLHRDILRVQRQANKIPVIDVKLFAVWGKMVDDEEEIS